MYQPLKEKFNSLFSL